MDTYQLQWAGSKCGQHGPYTFYKSFKFTKNSRTKVLSLGEFFFAQCSESDPLCIAEVQLLWEDRGAEGVMLASLRLYFLPEHTTDGRHNFHGKDEVVAVSGKVIMSIEDLLDWVIMEDVRWIDGFPTICPADHAITTSLSPLSDSIRSEQEPLSTSSKTLTENAHSSSSSKPSTDTTISDRSDVELLSSKSSEDNGEERLRSPGDQSSSQTQGITGSDAELENSPSNNGLSTKDQTWDSDNGPTDQKVMVVSYPNYCRYHANLRRVGQEGDKWKKNPLLKALGLLPVDQRHTKLLFCRDEFDHPMLDEDERLGEYTAPKLKGRPRKKKVKFKMDDNDDGYEPPRYHSSEWSSKSFLMGGRKSEQAEYGRSSGRGHAVDAYSDPVSKLRSEVRTGKIVSEELFLTHLYKYMNDRNTPIDRIPNLGFKQIDLFLFFELATHYGGYKNITSGKHWKIIYDKMGGNPNSTSAATCTRKHYERLLFPFEQYLRLPDRGRNSWSKGRDRKKKKDKKDRKKSRVKHVREQLEELEARRAAQRLANKALQVAGMKREMKTEPEDSIAGETMATETTVTNAAQSSAVPSTSAAYPSELIPPMSINGTPLVAMPNMMPPTSMVQLSGSPQFFPHLGLKGPVILAIPQVPVVATSANSQAGTTATTLGQQVVDSKPLVPATMTTVLDKVGAGVSLLQQRNSLDIKQEGGAAKTERSHHVSSNFIVKEEKNNSKRSMVAESLNGRGPAVGPLCSSRDSKMSVGSKESLLSRPSVIQHTHHAKVKSEHEKSSSRVKSRSGHLAGLQPNNNDGKNTREDLSDKRYKQTSIAEMQGLLGTGTPLMPPYIPFLPQLPFLLRPPLDLPGLSINNVPSPIVNSVSYADSSAQSSLKASSATQLVPELQGTHSTTKTSSSSHHSKKYGRLPLQEEPCDLSLPKKRRRESGEDGEPCEKRRESVISVRNDHSSGMTIRNSPVHRLRTSDKKSHGHSSLKVQEYHDRKRTVPSSSPSTLPLGVKMTPSPRGSITQGIINPGKNSSMSLFAGDPLQAPAAQSAPDLASTPRFPYEFPGVALPTSVDGSGKAVPPVTDLSNLTRFPIMPYSYYPLLHRPPFLPLASPYLPGGIAPAIPTSQAESLLPGHLPGGLVFRPPFPFAPTVPYSTAQLSLNNQHTSMYRK